MKRIMIIGSAGAGKSTLSRRLGKILNLEVIHLDTLFWKPGWIQCEKEEWRDTVTKLSEKSTWIIDGNYGGTLEERLKRADTVVFLDFNRVLCLYRAFTRMLKYRNKTRPDLTAGCKEKIDLEFYKWIWNYPKNSRPIVMDMIEKYKENKKIFILKRPSQLKNFIMNIKKP